jgi:PKD repeat protein
MKINCLFFLLFAFLPLCSFAQSTKRVLFLGNSYTAVNNLPQLIANFALAHGDTLIFDSNTPGGHTFQGHCGNATSLSKIAQGGWDYVVLQEQSQLPSFPINQVQTSVFPYAKKLDSLNLAANPCGESMFYMTWGRKNGDASNCANWPPVCTYQGMDSLLALRYTMMANDNEAELSPVGAVWKKIRATFPGIELYQSDESHPSEAGSYAAAVCFYTMIFKEDPSLIVYNYTLNATDAQNIRNIVKQLVFNQLGNWNSGISDPQADFSFTQVNTYTYQFNSQSQNAVDLLWNFDDGNTDITASPTHTFAGAGTYNVQLTATKCGRQNTIIKPITIPAVNLNEQTIDNHAIIYPNPTSGNFALEWNVQFMQIQITDIYGKLMLTKKADSPKTWIDIEDLPTGTYIIKAVSGEKQIRKFLIKN